MEGGRIEPIESPEPAKKPRRSRFLLAWVGASIAGWIMGGLLGGLLFLFVGLTVFGGIPTRQRGAP